MQRLPMKSTMTKVNHMQNPDIAITLDHLKALFPNEKSSYFDQMIAVIDIVNCKFRFRNTKNQSDLFDFFIKADYLKEMKNDLMYGTLAADTLFYFSSQFMEIKEYKANECIYYQGDACENIHLILFGCVCLRKLNKSTKVITGEQYYLHLKFIQHDNYLFQKTIEENENVYPIRNIDEITNIETIIIKGRILKYALAGEIDSIISILKFKGICASEFKFDEVLKGISDISTFYDDFLYSLTQSELYYIKEINNYSTKNVTILDYAVISEVKSLGYFGNFKLTNISSIREESAITLTPVVLIEISKKMYSGCILEDQRLMREKEMDYLHQSYFFKGLRRGSFFKYIFNEFDIIEHSKDHIIFNENDHLDTLYIIKEGSVELSLINKSLLDLKGIIKHIKILDPKFQDEEYNDVIKLSNPPIALMDELKRKKNFSLTKTTKTMLSEWEYFYNVNAMYTATICSDKARIYTLPIEKIRCNLFEDEFKSLNHHLSSASLNKLSGLLKRIIMIKNAAIEKIDIEFTNQSRKDDNLHHDKEQHMMQKMMGFYKSNRKMMKMEQLYSSHNQRLKTILNERDLPKKQVLHRKTMSVTDFTSSVPDVKKTLISMQKSKENSKEKESINHWSFMEKVVHQPIIKAGLNETEMCIALIQRRIHKSSIKQHNNTSNTTKHNPTSESMLSNRIGALPSLRCCIPMNKFKKRINFNNNNNNQKKKRRVISIDLPTGFDYDTNTSNIKSPNYLAVQKFYDNQTHRLIKTIK